MTGKELRELSVDELVEKEKELRASVFKLRFQSKGGREREATKIGPLKKDIARVKTIFHEKTLEN